MPSKALYKLTDEIWKQIVAYVRAGGFPHIAAEACGIPREVFDGWIARAELPTKGARRFRAFRDEVIQAQAIARLNAEIKVLKDDPLSWLRSGPGRETSSGPGWTVPTKPLHRHARALNALMHPEVQTLLAVIMQALAPFPEARAVLAQAMANLHEPKVIEQKPALQ